MQSKILTQILCSINNLDPCRGVVVIDDTPPFSVQFSLTIQVLPDPLLQDFLPMYIKKIIWIQYNPPLTFFSQFLKLVCGSWLFQ